MVEPRSARQGPKWSSTQLKADGSILVSYRIIATGTDEAAEDIVHHDVWYPRRTGALFQAGSNPPPEEDRGHWE